MSTPTPRTDTATYPADCLGTTLVTNRDCSRALERELATEQARLDAVIYDCWIIHKGNENAYAVRSLGEYITPWVATPRAAIDAAMKEGEK